MPWGAKSRGLSSSSWWGPTVLPRVPQRALLWPLLASREAAEWVLGPQHLLPAPLSWTGRSREGSWSHFWGRITACPGASQIGGPRG